MSARHLTTLEPELKTLSPASVVIVTPSYPCAPGHFAGHFVEARAQAFARDGHHVKVLWPGDCTASSSNLGVSERHLGGAHLFGPPGALARISENPLRLLQLPRVLLRARRYLLEETAHQVVFEWLLPFAPLLMDLKLSRHYPSISLVAHGSDVDLLCRLPAPWVSRFFERLSAESAHLTFVARRLKASLLEREELSGKARSYITEAPVEPAPISLLGFHPKGQRNGIGSPPRGLIVARLVPDKRVAEAIQAALVHGSVTVVGDGPERRRLERSFPAARFLGHLSRWHTLEQMDGSDFLVSASQREGAPTVVREARALGLPVAAREAGDLCEWAKEDPGLFIAPGNEPLERQVELMLHKRARSPAKLHGRVLMSS